MQKSEETTSPRNESTINAHNISKMDEAERLVNSMIDERPYASARDRSVPERTPEEGGGANHTQNVDEDMPMLFDDISEDPKSDYNVRRRNNYGTIGKSMEFSEKSGRPESESILSMRHLPLG
jgi:hypothetical protein